MSNKDLKSYKMHDLGYQTSFNLPNSRKRIEQYDAEDVYTKNRFKEAVEIAKKSIDTHIDIGCGTGWLLLKTSPEFKRVIGIEPSKHAVQIAKEFTKNLKNVEYMNLDMIDAMQALKIDYPVFITTSIVLSHMRDYYVKDLLRIINNLPTGSVLYFGEPYNENVQQNMWYLRNKKWWVDNLSEWDLVFKDKLGQYFYGIFAIKVGVSARLNVYPMSKKENFLWQVNGLSNKFQRVGRGIKRFLKRK